jgi:anti-sigma factor RsiW
MAMNDRFNPNDDIEALLPWYEKGTLPEEDARMVAAYLAANPERARFLELIREEVTQIIECNEAAGMPSSAAFGRLMDAIDAEPKTKSALVREQASGLLARLFGQNTSPWLAIGAAAACLVILVQAAALGVLVMRDGPRAPSGTGLASGDPAATANTGAVALIRFTPTATAQDISALLGSFNAAIVDGPKPGGVYRVKLSTQALTNEQVEEILRQIRARSDIIAFVSVSG